MPGLVHPHADERDQLLAFLDQQRYVVRVAAHGLTDEQARATPTAGALSMAGMVKHLAVVERRWIDLVRDGSYGTDPAEYLASFALTDDETFADVLKAYEEVAHETDDLISGISDLNTPVPIPKGVPWFPSDVDTWTVRWVLLHLIEETARHAGHADIVRESIDGATAFSLMAAVEHWPSMPWLKPWEPPAII
ncbi:MAG TPA: DinB family protein [Chloroflexota bacterium]|nr:DinB family protein [Chloroflexota bacterium]